ncbi:MAG: heavy-metal-associated domain-containing protein [Rhodospirillaceae bacterium]|jgi:copper chaperone|nr:heavy-metal-associated domain-containing protein [Rhodospirillaceae bacterium]MBT5565012.1 heavy-metal-associated domain-containing protein [Rhodospirillaceae bacterium]MBT6090224.1 heavy-metal-associated domain-containing protein [Rhodospirillaceae bacterium]MBT6962380.1 heavy-metal-associated domain-containing protein [Rhodospirillaceae bacterium]MBT7450482.1 heavy-metal-associated domain-containing protein [Rhodospirillaceae bacterium]
MEKVLIPVEGMTCGGCTSSVEKALCACDGVCVATASLEGANVEVEFDPAIIIQGQVEEAIRDAGFDVPG